MLDDVKFLTMSAIAVVLFFCALAAAKQPHIIAILQDDLGWYDVAFNGNEDAQTASGNITDLAKSGIAFDAHYTHWHCSPTRRRDKQQRNAQTELPPKLPLGLF